MILWTSYPIGENAGRQSKVHAFLLTEDGNYQLCKKRRYYGGDGDPYTNNEKEYIVYGGLKCKTCLSLAAKGASEQ